MAREFSFIVKSYIVPISCLRNERGSVEKRFKGTLVTSTFGQWETRFASNLQLRRRKSGALIHVRVREAKEMAYHITGLNGLIIGWTYIRMNKIARFIKCLLGCIN